MRLTTLAVIVSFALVALDAGTRTQQSEGVSETSRAWNNNFLITVQKKDGDPTRSGDVKIEFYGHDAFKVTSPAGCDSSDRSLAKRFNGGLPKVVPARLSRHPGRYRPLHARSFRPRCCGASARADGSRTLGGTV